MNLQLCTHIRLILELTESVLGKSIKIGIVGGPLNMEGLLFARGYHRYLEATQKTSLSAELLATFFCQYHAYSYSGSQAWPSIMPGEEGPFSWSPALQQSMLPAFSVLYLHAQLSSCDWG